MNQTSVDDATRAIINLKALYFGGEDFVGLREEILDGDGMQVRNLLKEVHLFLNLEKSWQLGFEHGDGFLRLLGYLIIRIRLGWNFCEEDLKPFEFQLENCAFPLPLEETALHLSSSRRAISFSNAMRFKCVPSTNDSKM